MCQKPVALRYLYGAWRRDASRQAIDTQNSGNGHWTCMTPGNRVGSARWKQSGRSTGRRLAPGGVRCPPGGWSHVPPSDTKGVLSGLACGVGSQGGFLHNFG